MKVLFKKPNSHHKTLKMWRKFMTEKISTPIPLVVFLVSLTLSTTAQAQTHEQPQNQTSTTENVPPYPPQQSENLPQQPLQTSQTSQTNQLSPAQNIQLERYNSMRTAGIALTATGIGVTVLGGALVVTGLIGIGTSFATFHWNQLGVWGTVYVWGLILAGAGLIAAIAGTPLWVIGSVRKKRLVQTLASIVPQFGYDPVSRTSSFGLSMVF